MGRRTVLAVDDEPTSLLLLVRALERSGHEVLQADSGTRALEVLATGQPEVVITDWHLPDLDGLEICRRVRAAPPGRYVYIVVLTVRREKEDIIAALDAGADEFLSKPFHPDELRARMRTAERILDLEAELAVRARTAEDALARLRESQERLVAAERLAAVGAVGITVRHEINNPLTGLLGFVDLMLAEQPAPPPSIVDGLARVRTEARRIADIVKRIEDVKDVKTKSYVGGTRMLDIDGPPRRPPGT